MGMNSINTNVAAMTALQSLQQTSKDMLTTQSRISTGLRVASASDNAAYWSIATSMRSDNAALSTVQDALGLGKGTVNVAYTAMNSSIDLVSQMKQKLAAALGPGVDRSKIQSDITELQNQLKGVADSASFSGENWLSVDSSATGYNATKSIVSSFTRNSSGAVSIGYITVDTSKAVLFDAGTGTGSGGILDSQRDSTGAVVSTGGTSIMNIDISSLDNSAADQATLSGYVQAVSKALDEMTSAATGLGANQTRINLQSDFVSTLRDSITTGVSQLVDADMNEESTRLQALQVKQQLGVQALSIANQSSQNILSLFRG
ncbi:Flagellin C [Hyphomicrobium sp. GJ21]|jgi:flagellin|uniref:flagellin N-terminal helical domain-containing protein n=1 Tax=Hyphomicrobium sp. GJ21 TaxID=113574 RepID=UPI000622C0A4|nr:flagellin [Hyphomicrobium sp. GJ21]MBN9353918.1 flagellin [Hyphomicrobium denitrificans]CEJ87373.1 Flagellin C [Hyphomicrobium sp. GJ21]